MTPQIYPTFSPDIPNPSNSVTGWDKFHHIHRQMTCSDHLNFQLTPCWRSVPIEANLDQTVRLDVVCVLFHSRNEDRRRSNICHIPSKFSLDASD